jgi:hypothetical protein
MLRWRALSPNHLSTDLSTGAGRNTRKKGSTAEVVVHPSGKFVYVSNRDPYNSIAIFSIDSKTGELKAVGHEARGVKTPRNFAIEPTGRIMLVANHDEWTVNKENRGVRWTIVWLTPSDPKKPMPVHPILKEIKNKEVEIDQPCCKFVPHALGLRQGQDLLAKNSSPVAHNINWAGIKNQGGNVLLPASGSYRIDGTFQAARNFVAGNGPAAVAVGDVNGDGNADLVIVGSMGVHVLLGNGDGTFQTTPISYVPGSYPWAVAVHDFNGDGRSDLAVANNDVNTVSILLNDGNWLP